MSPGNPIPGGPIPGAQIPRDAGSGGSFSADRSGRYLLIGADGRPSPSSTPGELGGHSGTRIYGRLDCPTALRALARGGYARHRVFFADTATARAAGYRPCGHCLPESYARWRRGSR